MLEITPYAQDCLWLNQHQLFSNLPGHPCRREVRLILSLLLRHLDLGRQEILLDQQHPKKTETKKEKQEDKKITKSEFNTETTLRIHGTTPSFTAVKLGVVPWIRKVVPVFTQLYLSRRYWAPFICGHRNFLIPAKSEFSKNRKLHLLIYLRSKAAKTTCLAWKVCISLAYSLERKVKSSPSYLSCCPSPTPFLQALWTHLWTGSTVSALKTVWTASASSALRASRPGRPSLPGIPGAPGAPGSPLIPCSQT